MLFPAPYAVAPVATVLRHPAPYAVARTKPTRKPRRLAWRVVGFAALGLVSALAGTFGAVALSPAPEHSYSACMAQVTAAHAGPMLRAAMSDACARKTFAR